MLKEPWKNTGNHMTRYLYSRQMDKIRKQRKQTRKQVRKQVRKKSGQFSSTLNPPPSSVVGRASYGRTQQGYICMYAWSLIITIDDDESSSSLYLHYPFEAFYPLRMAAFLVYTWFYHVTTTATAAGVVVLTMSLT